MADGQGAVRRQRRQGPGAAMALDVARAGNGGPADPPDLSRGCRLDALDEADPVAELTDRGRKIQLVAAQHRAVRLWLDAGLFQVRHEFVPVRVVGEGPPD